MVNIAGSLRSRRKLLYASEIWALTLETRTRARKLLSAQRIVALRVIAGITPIDLQAIERSMICNVRYSMTQSENVEAIKHEVFLRWQSRWENEQHGRWTYKLIPELQVWKNRKYVEVDYHLTQLHRMGKCSSPF